MCHPVTHHAAQGHARTADRDAAFTNGDACKHSYANLHPHTTDGDSDANSDAGPANIHPHTTDGHTLATNRHCVRHRLRFHHHPGRHR
jgi:hypothetical protein